MGVGIWNPAHSCETPLWPSVNRGARFSMNCAGGIKCTVVDERMTRSVLFEAPDATAAVLARENIKAGFQNLGNIIEGTSRFAFSMGAHCG